MPAPATAQASCMLGRPAPASHLRPLPPAGRPPQVSLAATGVLHQKLRVKNTGSESLQFTCALHTYFRVSGGLGWGGMPQLWVAGCRA